MAKWQEVLSHQFYPEAGRLDENFRTRLRAAVDKLPSFHYTMYMHHGVSQLAIADHIYRESSDFLQRFLELRSLFVASPIDPWDFVHLAELYQFLGSCGLLVDTFKYYVNWVMCTVTGQTELPAEPAFCLLRELVDQPFRNQIRWSRATPTKTSSLFFANTVFQGWKKGLLPCRVDKFFDAVKGQAAGLGGPSPPLTDHQRELIDRFVTAVHGTRTWRREAHDSVRRIRPKVSDRATVEYGVSARGNLGQLMDWWLEEELGAVDDAGRDAARLYLQIAEPPFRGYYVRTTVRSTGGYEQKESEIVEARYWISDDELLKYNEHRLHRTDLFGLAPEADVVPAGIPEPMKIRMISKPRVGDYAKLMGIQRLLWHILQDRRFGKTFELTGRTISNSLMREWEGRMEDWYREGRLRGVVRPNLPLYVSADYKGATDGLSGLASEYLMTRLLEPLLPENPELVLWAVESLCSSRIWHIVQDDPTDPRCLRAPPVDPFTGWSYNEWREHTGDGENYNRWFADVARGAGIGQTEMIQQQNGQLMGHVLSFPVLCMLNYLCYHQSWENYAGIRLRLFRDLPPALVNGDDLGFRTCREHYPVWEACLPEWGFVKSVGKNFVSPRWIQLNSTLFHRRAAGLTEIGFVNFGFLTSRGKAREPDTFQGWSSPQDLMRQQLATIPARVNEWRNLGHGEIRKVLMEADRDGVSPFTALVSSLPDLLRKQWDTNLPSVREQWVHLVWLHWAEVRSLLRFLPWRDLLDSLQSGDDDRYKFFAGLFRAFKESPMPQVARDLGIISCWKTYHRRADITEVINAGWVRWRQYRRSSIDDLVFLLRFSETVEVNSEFDAPLLHWE